MYLSFWSVESPAFFDIAESTNKDFHDNMLFYRKSSVNSGANDNYCIALNSEVDEMQCQDPVVNNYYDDSSKDLETYAQVIIAISGATFILMVVVLSYVLSASRNKSPMGGSAKSDF
jgi:hypothetical protein